MLYKASSVLGKARAGLGRAAPIVHRVRQVADVADAVARSELGSMVPGSGIVRGVAKAVQLTDRAVQTLAK
jgi:hypothetical protein